MKITINDKYILTNSELSYMLLEKSIGTGKKNKGEPIKKVLGYYNKIENCLNALIDIEIKKSDATSFAELIEVVNAIKSDIYKCLKVLKFQGEE